MARDGEGNDLRVGNEHNVFGIQGAEGEVTREELGEEDVECIADVGRCEGEHGDSEAEEDPMQGSLAQYENIGADAE